MFCMKESSKFLLNFIWALKRSFWVHFILKPAFILVHDANLVSLYSIWVNIVN